MSDVSSDEGSYEDEKGLGGDGLDSDDDGTDSTWTTDPSSTTNDSDVPEAVDDDRRVMRKGLAARMKRKIMLSGGFRKLQNAAGGSGSFQYVATKSMSKIRPTEKGILNPDNFPRGLLEKKGQARCSDSDSVEEFDREKEIDREKETDQGQAIIELFEDDEDLNYDQDKHRVENPVCDVCDRSFDEWDMFKKHHRRHMAPELFTCPKCKRGFVTLSLCLTHETEEHENKLREKSGRGNVENVQRYASTRATLYDNSDSSDSSENEMEPDPVDEYRIPSSALLRYQGRPVRNYAEAINVEMEYSEISDRDFELYHQIHAVTEEERSKRRNDYEKSFGRSRLH